jgi:hypothetical protein
MKLCKDCKYCQLVPMTAGSSVNYSKCLHPKGVRAFPAVSVVTGLTEKTAFPYCDTFARTDSGACKRAGILFEPSEAYTEFLREMELMAREERTRYSASSYEDYDFERDSGARY